MPQRAPYSYNKGPYRLKDVPGLVFGAAVISGGIYVLVRVLLGKKQAQEAHEAASRKVEPIAIQGRGHYR